MNILPLDQLTEPQRAAYGTLQARHSDLAGPFPTIGCDGAVMVETGGLYIGIERDGYAHT